jgi:hypothetical protein
MQSAAADEITESWHIPYGEIKDWIRCVAVGLVGDG